MTSFNRTRICMIYSRTAIHPNISRGLLFVVGKPKLCFTIQTGLLFFTVFLIAQNVSILHKIQMNTAVSQRNIMFRKNKGYMFQLK
jgi:hypothetical protein